MSETNEQKALTLLDINLAGESVAEVNSPRSLQAMSRQGIRLNELKKFNKEEIRQLVQERFNKKIEDKAVMDMYEKHLDERREMKLKLLKEVRQEIMEEQQQGMGRSTQKGSHMHSSVLSEQGVLINQHEREQMIIDKMKRRQENQVNTILSQEKRKSDIMSHMQLKEKKVQDNLQAIKKQRNERY